QVEGQRVAAVVDTGAELSVVNPQLAAATHRQLKTVARVLESKIVDAARQRAFAESIGFTRIALGPVSWRDRTVLVARMRVFGQIGLDAQAAMFVGLDLMSGRRIVLDYANASIWLER